MQIDINDFYCKTLVSTSYYGVSMNASHLTFYSNDSFK